jgi:hypothetical protein
MAQAPDLLPEPPMRDGGRSAWLDDSATLDYNG